MPWSPSTIRISRLSGSGHIGDGNLHLNILKPEDMANEDFFEKCQQVNKWVFEIVERYQGSVSAEHGVGMTKKPYLQYTRSEAEIAYLKGNQAGIRSQRNHEPGQDFRLMQDHIVVLTGAGISAESGLSTFRDNGGLWEQHSVYDVATPEAFARNQELVLRFYNDRRRQLASAQPNRAHQLLAELEQRYRVTVVTQNVDDLHERGGASNVIHLHGELTKARSSKYPELVYDIGYRDINPGDTCDRGAQLRPHIVWFGEEVPMLDKAAEVVRTADHLLIVGTSLQVYPAAGLVYEVDRDVPITVIDPGEPASVSRARFIRKGAVEGVAEWVAHYL